MPTDLEKDPWWKEVEDQLAEFFPGGVPLGMMESNFVTSWPRLRLFRKAIQKFLEKKIREIPQLAEDQERLFNEFLQEMTEDESPPSDKEPWKLVNRWNLNRVPWKGRWGTVEIWFNKETSKTHLQFIETDPTMDRLKTSVLTFTERINFTLVEAEKRAGEKLLQVLTEKQKKSYILTDSFLEIGKSGVWYVLRKNRPTLALRSLGDGVISPLCALCLHPLAYYSFTWAGAMPPSDEVLAHLHHIRADEKYFWRKANQIPLRESTSGV